MFITFSDGIEFPLCTAKGKSELVLSAQDLISVADREVIELRFDSTIVTMDSLMPYFLNTNEKTGIITLTNDNGESFIHKDYVIALKFSMEYIDGNTNPFIIMRLAKMNETDRTLREVAGTIKVYTGTDLEIAIAKKLDEISSICHKNIESGFDYNGDHYSLTEQDQTNILCWSNRAAQGFSVPYHADGEYCRAYSAEEFTAIVNASVYWIAHNTTYCNILMQYIKTFTDITAIENITYGIELEGEYLEKYNENMALLTSES